MKVRVRDGSGLVIVRDASVTAPARPPGADARPLAALKEAARAGHLFFIDTEDPADMPLAMFAGEGVPADLAADFEPVGGGFLLDVPSGRIVVSGYDGWTAGREADGATVTVAPGSYLLLAHARGTPDGRRYEAEMAHTLGAEDWAFHKRVARLAALGCLPLILLGLSLMLRRWRAAAVLAGLAALAYLPYGVLSRTRRYRSIEARRAEVESARPVYLLEVRPVERSPALVGGWVGGG